MLFEMIFHRFAIYQPMTWRNYSKSNRKSQYLIRASRKSMKSVIFKERFWRAMQKTRLTRLKIRIWTISWLCIARSDTVPRELQPF